MPSIPDLITFLGLLVALVGIALAVSSDRRMKAMQERMEAMRERMASMQKELQLYKKNPVSLEEEFQAVAKLAKKIPIDWAPHLIIGINPGGALVAEWLAVRFLGTRDGPVPFCGVWIEAKRGADGGLVPGKREPEASWHPQLLVRKRGESDAGLEPFGSTKIVLPNLENGEQLRVLLVNDVSRSGSTLKTAWDFVSSELGTEQLDLRTANVFDREKTLKVPPGEHYWAEEIPDARAIGWKIRC